jgi:hypothetical protein
MAGGPVQQTYAGLDFIPPAGTMNSATVAVHLPLILVLILNVLQNQDYGRKLFIYDRKTYK